MKLLILIGLIFLTGCGESIDDLQKRSMAIDVAIYDAKSSADTVCNQLGYDEYNRNLERYSKPNKDKSECQKEKEAFERDSKVLKSKYPMATIMPKLCWADAMLDMSPSYRKEDSGVYKNCMRSFESFINLSMILSGVKK